MVSAVSLASAVAMAGAEQIEITFGKRATLQKHVLAVHDKQKNFFCEKCDYASFLKIHLQAQQEAVGKVALAKLRYDPTMTEKDTGTMIDSKHRHQRGDFLPTHLQAQQDAVGMVALAKLRSDPESNVGQVSLGSLEILLSYQEEKGTFEHKTSDNKALETFEAANNSCENGWFTCGIIISVE